MKRAALSLALSLAGLLLAPLALAQTPPPQDSPPQNSGSDITRIIHDILGRDILGDSQLPQTDPKPAQEQSAGIDNIPVSISLADGSIFEGEWLVVSAFSAPKANGAKDSGELLGETRLLLRGLTPPFNIVVAAPTAVTLGLEFARIEGRIEDRNGNAVLVTQQDAYYRGVEPAQLSMGPKPQQLGAQLPPETIVKFEKTQGQVDISKPKALFRGAVLSVQLIESGLAGGTSHEIKGETRVQIDGQKPPFKFTLDYGVPENGLKMPLTLSAFITDWAGRKTHVMAKAVDYNGPDFDYRLTLDAFRQGGDVANFQFSDPVAASQTEIKGQALFNAYKGLPHGSYLQVRLRSPLGPHNQPRDIATTALGLDGLAGNVDFSIIAPSVNFDPELPVPMMDLAIMNPSGNALFTSEAFAVKLGTVNLVTLSPLAIY